MDPEQWQRVEEIFHQALERPLPARHAWLEQACEGDAELRAEVESLLDSDQAAAAGFLGCRVERAVLDLREDEFQGPRVLEGRQVGSYRLTRELGRGGMGAVYLAVRADQQYESEVAIKLVRPGLDTDFILRRFRRERQILARLQHPNIARLFDGGTTDDEIPYLVMEYVDGVWITDYAAKHRLSLEDRLRLFLPVCDAVEHAHRHFIIHRDLKPGNILIDAEGTPKLLDFGISKLLHADQSDPAETQGVGMMTPDYASPEQILGRPVGVVSDVYSLGAVLYELLTGALPHAIEKCTPLELERAICVNPTEAPSLRVRLDRGLSRRLSGDLDNIILRAMQKEPGRRYATVEQLAGDIRRHLEHRPIAARPDSLAYRAGRFIQRNRVAVTVGTLVTAALIGGATVTLREARLAQERFGQVRKLATTFVFDVEEASRYLPGSLRLRQLIARTGLDYLDSLSRNSARDWGLKREMAAAYMHIGEVQGGPSNSNLGDTAAALASYRSAEGLLNEVLRHEPKDRTAAQDRLSVLSRISNLQRQTGQMAQSTATIEEALRSSETLLATQPQDGLLVQNVAVFHIDLGRMRQQSGDLNGAAEHITAAIRLLERVVATRPNERETHGNIAAAHARLGAIEADLGHREEAIKSYRAGVAELENTIMLWPNDTEAQHELMLAQSHVGDTLGNPAYDNAGDTAGALSAYSKMAEIARKLHEAEPADVRATGDYGIALLRVGIVIPLDRRQEKLATFEKSHELLARAALQNPQDRPTGMHKAWNEVQSGDLFRATGDGPSASRSYQMALVSAEAALAIDPSDSGSERWLIAAARALAEDQARSGNRTLALALLDKAVRVAQRVESTAPPASVTFGSIVARARYAAGSVYGILAAHESGGQRESDLQAARNWYERSLETWRRLEPQRGFLTPHRTEMKAAHDALAALILPQTRKENSR